MSAAPQIVVTEAWNALFRDMPESEYHRRILGVVSKSAIMQFAKTPLRYRTWIAGEIDEEETPALIFGRAYHCAQLEPERFAQTYAVEPAFGDCRKTANKAQRDAWREANARKSIINADDDRKIAGMCRSVRAHPLASKMIHDGEAELSALWTDAETGLRCRARADFYSPKHRMIVDVKSCEDASPEGFRKQVFKYRYHWQHVLYRLGFAALGEKVEHFVFIAVEKSPPYDCAAYTLDSLGVGIAHDRVRLHMRRMAECLSADKWPGYDTSIQTIDTPPWEM